MNTEGTEDEEEKKIEAWKLMLDWEKIENVPQIRRKSNRFGYQRRVQVELLVIVVKLSRLEQDLELKII